MVSTGTPWVPPEDIPALLAEGMNVFSINRPGGLDLKQFSKIFGFTYAIIWQPIYGGGTDRDGAVIMKKGVPLPEKLKVDTLRSFGGFASASSQHHFVEGQSIPGLAFDRRDWAFVADMQASSATEQRQSIAKEHNVKGSFAFFRDGCVFEFGGEDEISEEKVQGLLKQFGGTRGPKPEEEELAAKPQRPAWKRQSSVAVMQVPAAS